MATTAVFAEILVIGFQAAAWVSLLVLGLFGTDWVTLSDLEKWVALITVIAVAAAYMLGVIMDRIADDVFLWGLRLGARNDSAAGPGSRADSRSEAGDRWSEVRRKRFVVIDASDELGRFLDYQRSRLRIARATVVNGVLSLPATALFLSAEADPSAGLVAFLAAAAMALILAAAYAAKKVGRAWMDSLEQAYQVVTTKGKAGRSPDPALPGTKA